jgi:hypothetical protein
MDWRTVEAISIAVLVTLTASRALVGVLSEIAQDGIDLDLSD